MTLAPMPRFRWGLHLGLSALLPAAFLASALAGRWPWGVERFYAQGLYPWIARAQSTLTAPLPFVAAEGLGLLAGGVVLGWAGLGLRAWRQGRISLAGALLRGLARLGSALGILAMAALLLWGLHYRRPPLVQVLGWPRGPFTPGEMLELAWECRRELDALDVPRDPTGSLRLPQGQAQVLRDAARGWEGLPAAWPVHGAGTVQPKALAFPGVLSRLLTTGVYSPLTGEPTVNGDIPAAWLPFVAAHELAHQKGIAREDEASFLAWALCRRHPDPLFRYAGALWTYEEALARVEGEASASLCQGLSPGARADLAAGRAWVRRWQGAVSRGSQGVYGGFLRSQGQPEGLRTYGRFLDLVLAERRLRTASSPAPGSGPRG